MIEDNPSTTQVATDQAQEVAEHAATRGKQVAASAGDQVQEVAGTAKEHVAEVASEVSVQAGRVLDDAKSHLREQAQGQTDQLSQALSRLGGQLRALTEGRPGDGGPVTDLGRQAAARVERIATRVESGGFEGIVSEGSRFARRRPGTFLAGAAAAGFVVGRLVKAGKDAPPSSPPAGVDAGGNPIAALASSKLRCVPPGPLDA